MPVVATTAARDRPLVQRSVSSAPIADAQAEAGLRGVLVRDDPQAERATIPSSSLKVAGPSAEPETERAPADRGARTPAVAARAAHHPLRTGGLPRERRQLEFRRPRWRVTTWPPSRSGKEGRRRRLKAEMGKVIVGQHAGARAAPHRHLRAGPLPPRRRAGPGQDADESARWPTRLNLSYNRIQFTPDLMPSDITGTEVIQEDKASGLRQFRFLRGPVFANIILPTRSTGRRPRPRPPARGDAGEPGDRARTPAPRALLRAGDAEPDRAGGEPIPCEGRLNRSCSTS